MILRYNILTAFLQPIKNTCDSWLLVSSPNLKILILINVTGGISLLLSSTALDFSSSMIDHMSLKSCSLDKGEKGEGGH